MSHSEPLTKALERNRRRIELKRFRADLAARFGHEVRSGIVEHDEMDAEWQRVLDSLVEARQSGTLRLSCNLDRNEAAQLLRDRMEECGCSCSVLFLSHWQRIGSLRVIGVDTVMDLLDFDGDTVFGRCEPRHGTFMIDKMVEDETVIYEVGLIEPQ